MEKKVREWREFLGVTQEQLAQVLALSRSAVASSERRGINSIGCARRYAAALERLSGEVVDYRTLLDV